MDYQDVYRKASAVVYGHAHAKKAMIDLIERLHIHNDHKYARFSSKYPKLHNIMLIGKSGTGKTLLVNTICKLTKTHVYHIDATALAPASAEGLTIPRLAAKVKEFITDKLKEKDDYLNIVLFIDEIDKICTEHSKESKWNSKIQASLLKLAEGGLPDLPQIPIIFAGAFQDIFKEKVISNSIGFLPSENKEKGPLIEDQIKKYGMIPELLGRIHHIVALDSLEKSDFKKILLELVIPEITEDLRFFKKNFPKLSKKTVSELIDEAYKSEQGVRMLYKLVDKKIRDIELKDHNALRTDYFGGNIALSNELLEFLGG